MLQSAPMTQNADPTPVAAIDVCAATTTATPLRVANVIIYRDADPQVPAATTTTTKKGSQQQQQQKQQKGQVQIAAFWRVMDLCAAAEERAQHAHRHLFAGGETIPPETATVAAAALTSIEMETCNGMGGSILSPLATRYPTLVRSLRALELSYNACDESAALGDFAALLTDLQKFSLSWFGGLTSVRGLEGRCEHLRSVNLFGCDHLNSLDGLGCHLHLDEVDASFTAITSIEALRTCPALKKVVLTNCQQLSSLEGLDGHRWLQEVYASGTAITSVEVLQTCPTLTTVVFEDCRQLASLEGLQDHEWLEEVNAAQTSIGSVAPLLIACPALKRVVIYGCYLLPAIIDFPASVNVTRGS